MVGITGGAESAVVVILRGDTGVESLLADGVGEIDLVVRGSDAGAEDGDEVCGVGAEFPGHGGDGVAEDVEVGAFFAGVEEGEGLGFLVEEVDGSAVGHMDAEEAAGLVGEEAIDSFVEEGGAGGDEGQLGAVDLLGEVGFWKAEAGGGLLMVGLEEGEGFLFIGGGGDSGNARDEVCADFLVREDGG